MNSDPIFKHIFGDDWENLPLVMKKHYANRPYHDEKVTAEGVMSVETSRLSAFLSPFLRMAGTLVPYKGKGIPVTVHFISTADSDEFHFDRIFYFPGRKPYRFHSRMQPVGGNEMVEFMRFGLGWRTAFAWNGKKIVLTHRGYVFRLFGFLLPLPLHLLIGKGYAEETPINYNEFSMRMEIRHSFWGKVYGYSGTFKILEQSTKEANRVNDRETLIELLTKKEKLSSWDLDSMNGMVHGLFNFDGLKSLCCDRDGYILHYIFADSSALKGEAYVPFKEIPQYTQSLDAQKKIIPTGWHIENFDHERWGGKFMAILKNNESNQIIKSAPQPTKELAALHAYLSTLDINKK